MGAMISLLEDFPLSHTTLYRFLARQAAVPATPSFYKSWSTNDRYWTLYTRKENACESERSRCGVFRFQHTLHEVIIIINDRRYWIDPDLIEKLTEKDFRGYRTYYGLAIANCYNKSIV